MDSFIAYALGFGFSHAARLDVTKLVIREEVRDMCVADKCNLYNKNWMCPPACGTLEKNASMLNDYTHGILVQTTGALDDDFDYDSMQKTEQLQQKNFLRLLRDLKKRKPNVLALGSGGCRLCTHCTYPHLPCRYPEDATVSMEAFGLWVSEVCEQNDLPYYHGPKTITYTGCYLLTNEK